MFGFFFHCLRSASELNPIFNRVAALVPRSFMEMKLDNIIPKELKEKKATRCHNRKPNKALMNKVFRDNFGAIPKPQDLVRSAFTNILLR